MRKIYLTLLALIVSCSFAFAQTGYVDYGYIYGNYPLARQYGTTIKNKQNQIINFAQQKDAQAKTIQNADERKNAIQEGLKQVEEKGNELKKLKRQYENEIDLKIKKASETVRVQKGLDIIIKADLRVTGGVDCTNEVLNILKNQQGAK